MSRDTAPGIETALARALRWTLGGAMVSLALLAIPQPEPAQLMPYTIVHLGALVGFGLVVAWDLSHLIDRTWFASMGPTGRNVAAGAAIVALVVGAVALVTLPTSAALRLAPSLQFLQLLSALDIAWAAGASMIGVRWLVGTSFGVAAGIVVGVVCVWSIWTYLTVVGFAPDGGWQVDGGALMRYVLPYDMAAAAIAVTALVTGAHSGARVTSSVSSA